MSRALKRSVLPVILAISLLTLGCFGRSGRHLAAFTTAVVAAAVITSLVAPPPPRVVYVPVERPGYVWQPGYWTREGRHWEWVDGYWVAAQPRAQWVPTHWEQRPDGSWVLEEGHWTSAYGY